MVASRQVENPIYKSIGRQRRRDFGAFAKVNGKTAIPFLRKNIVQAAKIVSADLLELHVPETADVVNGRENFKTAAKIVGRQTFKNNWVVVAENGLQAELFQQNLQNRAVGFEEKILQILLTNYVN